MYDIFVNWVYFVTFGSLIGYVIWMTSNLSRLEQMSEQILEQMPEQKSPHHNTANNTANNTVDNTAEKPSGNT